MPWSRSAGLIGVPAAYAMARRDFPGKRAVMLLFLLPLLVPPITYGIPLATVLYRVGFGGTMWGVILANLVPTVPFVILVMIPFIEQIDPRSRRRRASSAPAPRASSATSWCRCCCPGSSPRCCSSSCARSRCSS